MPGNNRLQAMKDMQLAQQMGAVAEKMNPSYLANTSNQPTLDPRNALRGAQMSAIAEAMGAPGTANTMASTSNQQTLDPRGALDSFAAQGISSTPWEVALSAGGPPTQTGNPWSGGQMERLKRLQPQERQQLLEALARESAPAASPQEMQQQQPSRFRMHGDRWRNFTGQPNGNPFSVPTNEEMERYKRQQEEHPIVKFRNFMQNKIDQFRR